MTIDFKKTDENLIDGFKGGKGPFFSKLIDDGKVKIMYNRLPAGSTIGLHKHEGNCEVMYVTKGEITFICDGKEETAKTGESHYCPDGHNHCAENRTDADAEFFAIVPQTK